MASGDRAPGDQPPRAATLPHAWQQLVLDAAGSWSLGAAGGGAELARLGAVRLSSPRAVGPDPGHGFGAAAAWPTRWPP